MLWIAFWLLALTVWLILTAIRLAFRLLRWLVTGRRARTAPPPPPAPSSPAAQAWRPGGRQPDWWPAAGAMAWVLHRHVDPATAAAELAALPNPAAVDAVTALALLARQAPAPGLACWSTDVLAALQGDHH